MFRNVVVFLQNAWSGAYAGDTWPRESWLSALRRCRSGQRLAVMERQISPPCEVWYDNTTPIVGATPDSVVPPDYGHIQLVLAEQKPGAVVACGRQAVASLRHVGPGVPLLCLPHPAYRFVTNELFLKAGLLLKSGFTGVVTLRQDKFFIE